MNSSQEIDPEMIKEALKHFSLFMNCLGRLVVDPEVTVETLPGAFKAGDAAAYIGTSRSTLLRYRNQGLIKTVTIGNRPKYLRKELDRFLLDVENGKVRVV